MHTYEQALSDSIEYFNGDELAGKVFVDKYALRNKDELLHENTPTDMHWRIAKNIARIQKKKYLSPLPEKRIFELIDQFKYIVPQGSPMYGIGNPNYVSIGNCFVLDPPEDTYNSILATDEQLVQISKRRGGVGIDLSKLRPVGSNTNNSSRTSTGVPAFMERYSNSIREVGQCIAHNQRVLTSTGLLEISKVKPDQMVWTKEGWVRVDKTIYSGKKEVYRVTTDAGYTVESSLEHVYQTENDGVLTETELADLEAGDKICLNLGDASHSSNEVKLQDSGYLNSNNKPSNCTLPKTLSVELAYLLGYSYGDGYVEKNEYGSRSLELACSNDHPIVKMKLKKCCKWVFDYDMKNSDGDGDLEVLGIYNKAIVSFLEHNNLLKQKSKDIKFPNLVQKASPEVQEAFIAGYFDADGYASGGKKGYCFASISLEFLKSVQVVLSTLGIASKIHFEDRSDKGWNTLYSLVVVGKTSQERFVKHINESVKVVGSNYVSKRDCWLTPFKAKSFDIKYNNYSYCPDNSQNLSLSTALKLKTDNNHVNTNLITDRIAKIEYVGNIDCYDLTLEAEHLFWCEGFYVHNSGRRGALMLSLSVHHPDVEEFATIKKDRDKVTGANISVRLTDEFLQAVQDNEEYVQRWPLTGKAKVKESVSARDVWHTLISSAHEMAEPGLLFWDNIIKESPADCYENFQSVSTNPCAELPLSSMDACRLLCLNLLSYVVYPYTEEAKFDLKLFFEHSKIAARMMDDIVDLEEECINRILEKIDSDPDPEEIKSRERSIWTRILESCVSGRRCGLGITALGDTLAALGLDYGSDESIDKAEEIYKALKLGSYTASVEMAEELGPFDGWDYEKEKSCPFLKRFKKDTLAYEGEVLVKGKELYERMKVSGRRNIAMLTIAPTGSVSTMTRTTSGVEPAYLLEYTRRKKGNPGDSKFRVDFVDGSGDSWMEFKVYHPQVAEWMRITGETDVEKSPWFGCCAPDLDWPKRVKLQSALQRHCDHSISSTVNLPSDATVDQVKEIYETAWKSGCKGITVYRDGSRTGVLVKDTKKEDVVIKRPDDLPCEVYHISVKTEPYFVLIGLVDGKPYEVFAGRNGCIEAGIKTGIIHKVKRPKCYRATFDDGSQLQPITAACSDNEEALTRMISMSLRHGAEINYVVDQLQKTQGSMTSLAKAIARALKKHVPDGAKSSQKCGECGSSMIFEEGCNKCPSCGASKCS